MSVHIYSTCAFTGESNFFLETALASKSTAMGKGFLFTDRIAAKGSDVIRYPLESQPLVLEREIPLSYAISKGKDVEPVVEGDNDDGLIAID